MKALINYYWTDDMDETEFDKEVVGTEEDVENAVLALEENGAVILDLIYEDERWITLHWHMFGRTWKTRMPSWMIKDAKKYTGVEMITSDLTGEILWMRSCLDQPIWDSTGLSFSTKEVDEDGWTWEEA